MKIWKHKLIIVMMIGLASLFIFKSTYSQSPEMMSYQAIIRDNAGEILSNQSIEIRVSILQGGANGIAVYVESQTSTTNTNGLISLKIGGGALISGNFSTIDWTNGPFFIKSETDLSGGSNYSIINISELLSVPYAMFAKNSAPGPKGPKGLIGPGNFIHYIGEQYGGGVVFHLWKDTVGVEHGLIVNLHNIGSIWSNVSALIGASAQSTWDGMSNTYSIVGQIGHINSAAALCLNLSSGGHVGWYLPSIGELNILLQNSFNVNKTLSSIGGTILEVQAFFWSSTELSSGTAPYLYFGTSYYMSGYKNEYKSVRAIRSF